MMKLYGNPSQWVLFGRLPRPGIKEYPRDTLADSCAQELVYSEA